MRIALAHPYSWPAVRRGGERYVHDLGRWLAGQGHDVTLLTGEDEHGYEADGVRTVRVPLRLPARLARRGVSALDTFGASVLPHLARERYDVVHALVPSTGLAAVMTLQPSVWTALGHPSPENPPASRWSRRLVRQATCAVRVPAALSRSAADGLEQLTGRRPIVLPPGVHTAEFPPRLEPRTGPARLLFPAFAGDGRKRLSVLLTALPAVLEAKPDTRLVLSGGGDPSAAFDSLEAGVRRAVLPHVDALDAGELADVPLRYREATLTVLPSVHEAFGLVLVESLACGTPVVCSASGGMPEIVDDKVGRLAAPDDPGSLADAILGGLSLAADPAVVRRCVQRARQWDWDLIGPRHALAYGRARG
jgi:phosphatidylinositol alpha-mannosyltransferase